MLEKLIEFLNEYRQVITMIVYAIALFGICAWATQGLSILVAAIPIILLILVTFFWPD